MSTFAQPLTPLLHFIARSLSAFSGGLLYTIFKELFSSSSPNIIYGNALGKCRSHPEVIGVFGEPVKGFGEMSRRGRRQHVSFIEYANKGLKRIRVKFYIEGSEPGKQGTVHAEVEEVYMTVSGHRVSGASKLW